jgi:hypothetical protein
VALSRALVYGSDRARPARDFCCWAFIGAERSPVSCSVIEGRAGVCETNQTEGREISFTRHKIADPINPCILLLYSVHRSDRRRKGRSILVNLTLPRRQRMSILDEITKEKQRVSEALGRVDAQREKLTSQLSELEATERVLARYSKGTLRPTKNSCVPYRWRTTMAYPSFGSTIPKGSFLRLIGRPSALPELPHNSAQIRNTAMKRCGFEVRA